MKWTGFQIAVCVQLMWVIILLSVIARTLGDIEEKLP